MASRFTGPRKVVVTAAGQGTRLLPMTKELPKEMLPIYAKSGGNIILKPLLQALFEQFYKFGFRDFCFVVGRSKRAIEDHFTPDTGFLERSNSPSRNDTVKDIQSFYRMINNSNLIWINQPEPKGFGHAILMTQPYVKDEPFFVTAGDTIIISRKNNFLDKMMRLFLNLKPAAVLLLDEVDDPRAYGVASVAPHTNEAFKITSVVEKPKRPPSNLILLPLYIFSPSIFESIRRARPGPRGEIELTDGIQGLINKGEKVVGLKLQKDELRLDIGTPTTFLKAIKDSYKHAVR